MTNDEEGDVLSTMEKLEAEAKDVSDSLFVMLLYLCSVVPGICWWLLYCEVTLYLIAVRREPRVIINVIPSHQTVTHMFYDLRLGAFMHM